MIFIIFIICIICLIIFIFRIKSSHTNVNYKFVCACVKANKRPHQFIVDRYGRIYEFCARCGHDKEITYKIWD